MYVKILYVLLYVLIVDAIVLTLHSPLDFRSSPRAT